MSYIVIKDVVAYRGGVLTKEGNELYNKVETICKQKEFHRLSCIAEAQKELGCRRCEAEELVDWVFRNASVC